MDWMIRESDAPADVARLRGVRGEAAFVHHVHARFARTASVILEWDRDGFLVKLMSLDMVTSFTLGRWPLTDKGHAATLVAFEAVAAWQEGLALTGPHPPLVVNSPGDDAEGPEWDDDDEPEPPRPWWRRWFS